MLNYRENKKIEAKWFLSNVLLYFEHLRYLFGFFLAIVDTINHCFDSNIETYFHTSHYPFKGLYLSPRRIWNLEKKKLQSSKTKSSYKSLQQYLKNEEFVIIKRVFDRIKSNN
ncbi:unnamed protein product, partial [marine sediment metagenome]